MPLAAVTKNFSPALVRAAADACEPVPAQPRALHTRRGFQALKLKGGRDQRLDTRRFLWCKLRNKVVLAWWRCKDRTPQRGVPGQ